MNIVSYCPCYPIVEVSQLSLTYSLFLSHRFKKVIYKVIFDSWFISVKLCSFLKYVKNLDYLHDFLYM